MCLREIKIHRRVLNAHCVLFSVVLVFYRAKPCKLKVSGVYQERHGRRARAILWQHWDCNTMGRKLCKRILRSLFNINSVLNRPRSIYQYSNLAPRLSGQNCKFFKFLLSVNSRKRLEYKENDTKYRSWSWKPQSHVRILIYRTWSYQT